MAKKSTMLKNLQNKFCISELSFFSDELDNLPENEDDRVCLAGPRGNVGTQSTSFSLSLSFKPRENN